MRLMAWRALSISPYGLAAAPPAAALGAREDLGRAV